MGPQAASPSDLLRRTSIAIRVLQLATFVLLLSWIFGYLGGLSFGPAPATGDPGANDTSALFNWHPLLMTAAFVGCMAEAIMTYSTTPSSVSCDSCHIPATNRPAKKLVHASLHCSCLVLSLLGIAAAIRSHTLKRPAPMPNFYSTHSYLGILACCMMSGQLVVGFLAYAAPRWSLPSRQAFSPLHRFFGGATFVVGMTTAMVGLQEKTTFLQLAQHPSVRGGAMQLPAFLQVVLAAFVAAVAFRMFLYRLIPDGEGGEEEARFRSIADHEISVE
jgi:cytochrome b-561